MKYLLVTLLLLGSLVAQTPAVFTVHPTGIDMQNASSKEILFVSLRVTLVDGRSGFQTHDYYFERVLSPGNSIEVVHDDPNWEPYAKADLQYVQFTDGTSWGTADDHVMTVLAGRKAKLDFLNRIMGAFSTGGESALSDALIKETEYPKGARYLKSMLDKGGSAAVISMIQDCLAQAHKRSF